MSGLMNQILRPIAKWYQGRVNKELAQFGLRYHDCLVEDDLYLKAVSRLPEQEQIDRQRRIKRAADISLKKSYLPESYDTGNNLYMTDLLNELKAESDERKLLNKK